MSDQFDLNSLSKKEREAIDRILQSNGGESDDAKTLKPLPDRNPVYYHDKLGRPLMQEKRQNLLEHLGVLEESLLWAINDVDNFEKKMELNPAKRVELVQAVDNIGKEIEMVTAEIRDLDKHL